jgi:hypothetical protein
VDGSRAVTVESKSPEFCAFVFSVVVDTGAAIDCAAAAAAVDVVFSFALLITPSSSFMSF